MTYEDRSSFNRLEVTSLNDLEPESITWLWDKRIPLGKITVICGDPGMGKSLFTLDIAARVSRGSDWPDRGSSPTGNILLMSAEDGASDTILPRLMGLNADLERIKLISPSFKRDGKDNAVALSDHLELIEQEIRKFNCSVLILDPLLAFTGAHTNTHKMSEVRSVMAPLSAVANRTGCAVVAVMHLNKNSKEGNLLYRVMASLDIVAVARSVLLVGKNPTFPDQRVVAPLKANLSSYPESLGFHIDNNGSFSWDGIVNLNTATILQVSETGKVSEMQLAIEFLTVILSSGPVPANEVLKEAAECKLSEKTVRRAYYQIGVKAKRVGEPGVRGGGTWWWSLSEF